MSYLLFYSQSDGNRGREGFLGYTKGRSATAIGLKSNEPDEMK